MMLQKKSTAFIIILLVFSANVLASTNAFSRFERHEPNTPQTQWPKAFPDPSGTSVNPVAFFRDDAVGAVHFISNAVAGETWTVEVQKPNPDGSAGGVLLTPGFSTIRYDGNCFRAWGMRPVCGSPNWGIRWFIQSQCESTGTWTFNLKNNGQVFHSAQLDLLPKVNHPSNLLRYAEAQGNYTQPYDSIWCKANASGKIKHVPQGTVGAHRCTIAEKGCALTAVNMVMKYHGRNSGFASTPEDINAHLSGVRDPEKSGGTYGYDKDGNIKWSRVKNYQGSNVKFDKITPFRDDVLLREKLCKYGPTPIAVNKTGHFVVATGIVNENTAAQTVEILDSADGKPATLAQKYNNNYNGIRSYKGPESAWTSDNGIEIRVYSPVELMITDPQGRRVGYDLTAKQKINEIPDAAYGVQGELSLEPGFVDPDPMKFLALQGNVINGIYKLDVIGTGNGHYDILFMFDDNNGDPLDGNGMDNIPVTVGTVHTYTFNYNSRPSSVIAIQGGAPVAGVNSPPAAHAGVDQVVECSAGFGNIVLNGTASSDPDGDALTYTWSGTFGTLTGINPAVNLPLGTHNITLTVDDGKGGTTSDVVLITVQDTIAPMVNAGADVTIQASTATGAAFNLQATVSDACCTAQIAISPQMLEYPIGTTAITATATDCAGNTATDVMLLTVQAGAVTLPPLPILPPTPPVLPTSNAGNTDTPPSERMLSDDVEKDEQHDDHEEDEDESHSDEDNDKHDD